jgi:hypothetical protein
LPYIVSLLRLKTHLFSCRIFTGGGGYLNALRELHRNESVDDIDGDDDDDGTYNNGGGGGGGGGGRGTNRIFGGSGGNNDTGGGGGGFGGYIPNNGGGGGGGGGGNGGGYTRIRLQLTTSVEVTQLAITLRVPPHKLARYDSDNAYSWTHLLLLCMCRFGR